MAYSPAHHAITTSSVPNGSSNQSRKHRSPARDEGDKTVLTKARKSSSREQRQSSHASGARPLDERRQSFLGAVVRKDIFKRHSLQLPNIDNSNSSSSNPRTIDNLPLQKNNVNVHTSPNSFAARTARNSLAVAPMAYNSTSIKMSQAPANAHLSPYTDSNASQDGASICHSPTWGEEKSKKKQSGWAWKKSSNPKQKPEPAHEPNVKQGKRLNKKPPSAMETQKYSASLANSLGSEAPQMERRPSSSSGSFTLAMRGFLSRRSSQTTSPETSRPVSRSRPQSSSQELKARELSHKLSWERKRQENEAQTSAVGKRDPQKTKSSKVLPQDTSSQGSPPIRTKTIPTLPNTPPRSSGQESKGPTPPPKNEDDLPRTTSVPSSISRMFGKKDNAAGGYKYPAHNNKLTREQKSRADTKTNSNAWLSQTLNNLRGNSITEASRNGTHSQVTGGYVARERRVHQQRSIARFQDEMAVTSAYDQFLTESQLPPTPQDSSESVHATRSEPLQEGQYQSALRSANGRSRDTIEPVKANSDPFRKPAQSFHTPPVQIVEARTASEKTTSTSSRSPEDKARPGPGVIQPTDHALRNHSLPTMSQQNRFPVADLQRQPKDSVERATTASTSISSSSTTSRTTVPHSYQLPPISASSTSPILSAFLDHPSVSQPPPAFSLNDSSAQTNPPAVRKPVPTSQPSTVRTLGSKKKTELLIASENAEGLTRKTSLKKSRSDPELKVPELKIDPPPPSDLPSLDFLPELKHQPLTKPKRPTRVSFAPGAPGAPPAPLSPSQFPVPVPTTEVARRGGSGLRTTKWSSLSNGTLVGANAGPPKPVAKMFVICCKCKFWHDLPSKIYEAMALPQAVGKEDDIAAGIQNRNGNPNQADGLNGPVKGLEGKIFTQVKCPWCEHGMSTSCCAGWTAVIYLHERHH